MFKISVLTISYGGWNQRAYTWYWLLPSRPKRKTERRGGLMEGEGSSIEGRGDGGEGEREGGGGRGGSDDTSKK